MKFSLFIHLERNDPGESYDQLYREFATLCEMADAGGFSTIWTGEHHGMDFTISPNPFLVLVDLARRCPAVRLGTGAIVAPFWHPVRLAGEAAMADLIVGGRLELGLARGAYSFEYDRIGGGIDAAVAGEKLREMVPAVRGLWAGDYAHAGKHWSFPATTAIPRPLDGAGPPLWIAARDPASFAFAMANGCNIQVTPLWNDDTEVEALATRFADALAQERPVRKPKLMLLRHAFVGRSGKDIERAAHDLSRFYCNFSTWFQNHRPVSEGRLEPLSEAEVADMTNFAPETMHSNLVVGRPGEVIDRLRRYQALGFDEFSYWIDSGMSFAAKRQSLALFISEVMPAFLETGVQAEAS